VGEKPVKWEYFDDADRQHLYLVWAKILDLRKNYPVFNTDDYTLAVGNNTALKKIVLRHEEEDALVTGNFGLTEDNFQPGFIRTGWWYEVFSGDSVNVTDLNMTISLDASEYRIYTSKKTESVISGKEDRMIQKVEVYPNPAKNVLYISVEEPASLIEVFNATGNRMLAIPDPNHNTVDVSGLPEGYYFLRIRIGNDILTGRFIKR